MCRHKGSKAAIESMIRPTLNPSLCENTVFLIVFTNVRSALFPSCPSPQAWRGGWDGVLGQKGSNQHLDFYVNVIKCSGLPHGNEDLCPPSRLLGSSCVHSSVNGLKQHYCELLQSPECQIPSDNKQKSNVVIFTGPGLITFSVCKIVYTCQISNWVGKIRLRWRCWHNETMRLIAILSKTSIHGRDPSGPVTQ